MKHPFVTLAILLFSSGLVSAQGWPGRSPERRTDRKETEADNPVVLRNAIRINTEAMEFAPVRYGNGIVYVTSRMKAGPRVEDTWETFFDLYYAELDAEGMPQRPRPFSEALNSPLHENAVTFDPVHKKIYFTRNSMENGLTRGDSRGVIRMKIYEASLGPFDWENIRELPFNSNEYSCLHPTLSPDGTKLFFASDMPNGLGGFDIWFVIREEDGRWSEPINLQSRVNTTKNELFPFLHESGVLFFSSDGYRGQGGLDIYSIDISSNRWGAVRALPEPFNSPADDLSFSLDPEGLRGFFASNREGGFGKDDIYAFETTGGVPGVRAVRAPVRQPAVVAVRDGANERPLAGADVRLFELGPDGQPRDRGLFDVSLSSNGAAGRVMTYAVRDGQELGPPKAITDRQGTARLDLALDQPYLILVSKPGYQQQQLTYTMHSGAPVEDPLSVVLPAMECLTLNGVVRHDRTGQALAGAVVRVVNECSGEVTVLESQMNGAFTYCLASGCDFTLQAEKNGFQIARTTVSTVKIRGSRSLDLDLRLVADADAVYDSGVLREGSVFVLDDLYYAFGESAIGSREAGALEQLARLMEQDPGMEVELGAHTDCRGDAGYNLKLSLRRAEEAKAVLVRQGIAASRIRAFGYGETRPRNQCVDGAECTEEEHAYNRRTEVKVARISRPVRLLPAAPPETPEQLQNRGGKQ